MQEPSHAEISKTEIVAGALLLRCARPHPALHGGAGAAVFAAGVVEVWASLGCRNSLRMRHCLYQFPLAQASDYGFLWIGRWVPETAQTGQGIVFRFLLRYVLMAVGAYVILTVSPASLNGLLAGLFLPVVAISCEAIYELYAALARGFS